MNIKINLTCLLLSNINYSLSSTFLVQNWYALSKILSEDAAWKFAKENKIDLVTLHPGLTIGPLLQPTLNLTVEMVLNHINGKLQQLVLLNA